MSAILLIFGVWVLFANTFGDTSLLTTAQVFVRCVFGLALICAGLGVIAWDVYKILH